MPLISTYNIGTATFTQGSKTVTGTGTNWIGAGIREGDIFWSDGLVVRVETLVNNNELTLAYEWPGASRTNRIYEIQYTSDSSRVLAKSTQLLDDLDTTALNPLKNITPQADRVPYYTGAATAALAPFTSKARQLVALTTNAQILENLGISFQASRFDKTANKVLRTGSFGLGTDNVEPVTNIDDTVYPTAILGVNPATAQGTLPPLVGTRDAILNISITANIVYQVYFSTHTSSPIYTRRSENMSTWQAWNRLMVE